MSMQEMRSIRLPWDEISKIISSEIEQVLGVQIQCKVNVSEEEFWDAEFVNQHLPLPEYCYFIHSLNPSSDDWADALPDEVRPDIGSMGPYTGEKIIEHHLHIAWEHRIIAEDALWLVGVTENDMAQPTRDGNERKLPDDLAQAITVLANHFYGKERADG